MNDQELYLLSLLIGQVLPRFIDVVNKHIGNAKIRFYMALGISLALGVAFNIDQLSFSNTKSILLTGLILWGSSQAAYKTFYEGSDKQQEIRFSTNLFPLKPILKPL